MRNHKFSNEELEILSMAEKLDKKVLLQSVEETQNFFNTRDSHQGISFFRYYKDTLEDPAVLELQEVLKVLNKARKEAGNPQRIRFCKEGRLGTNSKWAPLYKAGVYVKSSVILDHAKYVDVYIKFVNVDELATSRKANIEWNRKADTSMAI
jgi:hypothetical protein